jgi:hypothetical protein
MNSEEQAATHTLALGAPRVDPPFADPDKAREAGLASAAARRRKAAMTPEARAQEAISKRLPDLTKELIDAALGAGDFTELKLETRVTALTRLMEWKLGRPSAVKPKEDEDPEEAAAYDGNDLFAPSE